MFAAVRQADTRGAMSLLVFADGSRGTAALPCVVLGLQGAATSLVSGRVVHAASMGQAFLHCPARASAAPPTAATACGRMRLARASGRGVGRGVAIVTQATSARSTYDDEKLQPLRSRGPAM